MLWYSPHVDEILRQRYGVRISSYGDSAIRRSALPLLAIADTDHGAGDLTNLSDLGATLADYATDQLVWHGHLVRLIVRRRLLSVRVACTKLAARQRCQCYETGIGKDCANIRRELHTGSCARDDRETRP